MTPATLLAALVAGIAALLVARKRVAGTTLVAAWWWSFAAFAAAGGLELLIAWQAVPDNVTAQTLRYAARMLLLCPTISLLGVKRPQDGPWNFVVLSLWGVLALPAAESLFLNTGQPLEIGGFRSWFVLGLVLVCLVNSVPTRHWPAALAAVGGQALLLAEYLPFHVPQPFPWQTETGVILLAAATTLYALRSPPASASSLDQLWLDFRDAFGLFWGLRVQERIATAARMYQWPVTLHWTGWRTANGEPLPEKLRGEIMTTFRGLLRRFVSNEWMDSRLKD